MKGSRKQSVQSPCDIRLYRVDARNPDNVLLKYIYKRVV